MIDYKDFLVVFAGFFGVVVMMPGMIRWIHQKQFGQPIRELGPESHQKKAGTPTMGGALCLWVWFTVVLFFSDDLEAIWPALAIALAYGLIGGLDDWAKVARKHNRGISGRTRLLLGAGFSLGLLSTVPAATTGLTLQWPFMEVTTTLSPGLFLCFGVFVVVGSANAVNLTDGLDGLAMLPILLVTAALAMIGVWKGETQWLVPSLGLIGVGLGFLWFNAQPASIFMGDVGALAWGSFLGFQALMLEEPILLAIMGGLFVVETVSVMLQVLFFKMTGKRIFRMAPIHHHFELMGLAESKVTVRAWILTALFVGLGLASVGHRYV